MRVIAGASRLAGARTSALAQGRSARRGSEEEEEEDGSTRSSESESDEDSFGDDEREGVRGRGGERMMRRGGEGVDDYGRQGKA